MIAREPQDRKRADLSAGRDHARAWTAAGWLNAACYITCIRRRVAIHGKMKSLIFGSVYNSTKSVET